MIFWFKIIHDVKTMYEKMYHILFNAITDAMEEIEAHQYQEALNKLEWACRDAEEMYISE